MKLLLIFLILFWLSVLAAGVCKVASMRRGWSCPLPKNWLQQPHHKTQVPPSAKLVLWERIFKDSKCCTEGGRAGNKKSDNKQREHQGQEQEEKSKDEVFHGGADSHTAACGEDYGRAGGCFLKELWPMGKCAPWSKGKNVRGKEHQTETFTLPCPLNVFQFLSNFKLIE